MQSHTQGIYQIQLCKWQTHDDSFLVSVIEDLHKMVVSSACQRNQHPWNKKCRKIYLCIIFKKRKVCCIICTWINFNSPLWSGKIFNTVFVVKQIFLSMKHMKYHVCSTTCKWVCVCENTHDLYVRERTTSLRKTKKKWYQTRHLPYRIVDHEDIESLAWLIDHVGIDSPVFCFNTTLEIEHSSDPLLHKLTWNLMSSGIWNMKCMHGSSLNIKLFPT